VGRDWEHHHLKQAAHLFWCEMDVEQEKVFGRSERKLTSPDLGDLRKYRLGEIESSFFSMQVDRGGEAARDVAEKISESPDETNMDKARKSEGTTA